MDANLEAFSLVWLHFSANGFEENHHAYQQLRSTINHIRTFEDERSCEKYIKNSSDDRIVVIVSGQLNLEIINRIQRLENVRVVLSDINELIVQIKADQNKRNKIEEPLSISVLNNINEQEEKSSLDINGTYLHYQLLIDVLMRMLSSSNDKNELIDVCKKEYQNNSLQHNILDEFEHTYCSDQAIWWYTRESFLYRILNKALRVQNIDLLFLFRFFIRDIYQQLEKLKSTQSKQLIRVYRAQLLANDELAVLANSVGRIISMNSFLSASRDQNYVLFILGDSDPVNDCLKRVIFQIDADLSIENIKPFADVSQNSFFREEQEVLFMAGSIFRLTEIKEVNGIWTIGLVLCREEENDLRALYKHMTKKKTSTITLLTLGSALSESGKFNQAERFFQKMLQELPSNDYSSLAESYQGLAIIFAERGDYEGSLVWNQKALELLRQELSPDHPDIGFSYNNIGIVYWKMNQLENALESLRKAVNIFEKTDDEDRHHRIAACYTNMALIRRHQKRYEEALEYLYKSLALNEQVLPSDHHSLAETHTNIGSVYKYLGLFDIALEHFNRSLSISLRSLPHEHRNIAIIYCNMGIIYEAIDDFNLALIYYEKASVIFHKTLPDHHSQLINCDLNLQRVKSQLSKN
ncbi:unnamed protein product [Adineta ricciae]|uniref:Uncharacterized protein n=1 Tax=Adineta ricciae TaxID=249248 RepID=A0A815BFG5_ADIRI|nr:unnamed protein product [Adineta ricciae]